jgi:hypothetical protein
MNTKQNSRYLWIALTLLGCGLALVALAGQVVNAQSLGGELTPPFEFEERLTALDAQTPGPGSTVLLTENFGASFDPTKTLTGNTPLWRVFVNPGDTAGYYWDRVSAGAFSNSAWSAADPATLNPGVSNYPAGQDSWLIYGPIDLSKFVYGHLSFEYYLDSQSGDKLLWGYSTDGQTFYGNSQSGQLGKWITDTLSFQTDSSFKTVYLAFAFKSTASLGKGAFVRNVKITAEPVKYVYLPLVMNNYAPPPPPPLFGYTFDPGNTTDLAKWGGAYYNSGTTKYGQCIPGQCTVHPTTPHGNPANSLRLYTNGLYSFIATSPNDVAPDNYDLYVDMSPWVIYPKDACSPYGCPDNDLGDWYGIIFNAKSDATTFGANPSEFRYNTKYYRLYFYNMDSVRPVAIRLDRCDGSSNPASNSCQQLAVNSLPGNFVGNASAFDTVHIKRLAGGTIQVWLNGNSTPVLTASDNTYTTSKGFGKFGVFIFSWTKNDTSNPPTGTEMQIDFDNIKLYQP